MTDTKVKYANEVYGNLAYDFSAVPAYEPEVEEPSFEIPEFDIDQKVRVKTEAHQAYGISLFTITGLVLVAITLVLLLLTYVNKTQIAGETVVLRDELAVLQQDNARLRIQHAAAFDLNEIEKYATETLGMVKPTNTQIAYIYGENADKAEIIIDDSRGIVGGVRETIGSALEYLR